jgi:hypothetical protein
MRTIVTMTVAGMIALSASAAHADEKKADQKFCAAVTSFRTHIAELDGITPKSTVGELRAASDKVNKDASDMEKAAKKIKTPTGKQFTADMKKLREDVKSVTDQQTLEEARTKISSSVQSARTSGQALSTEAGCPPPKNE